MAAECHIHTDITVVAGEAVELCVLDIRIGEQGGPFRVSLSI
jgi:hypothetical protein